MLFVVWLCGGGASSIRVIFQHYDGTDGAVTWKTTTLLHSVKCFSQQSTNDFAAASLKAALTHPHPH
jgi:hypothetical protein